MTRLAEPLSITLFRGLGWLLLLPLAGRLSAADASPDDLSFFEARIRPLLAERCFSCHGEEKQKGHLRLDSLQAMLAGGENGPALVLGNPDQSRLVQAVAYTNADLQMPPKKKLGDRATADLARWIKSGAPWPGSSPGHGSQAHPARNPGEITDEDRAWWAFQPIRRPAVPAVRSKTGLRNPIDAFVFARLEAKGLAPNPAASRRELIRRAYFDLIGLPPAPEEVAAFEQDRSSSAWDQLIDRLLALPQYGERWGRHWLDVARFAQSNGYERDGEKPYAWRYRDYVVKAFNDDKPYDQFVREQIAGDELPGAGLDGLIATGFQRLGVWDDEPDDKRMAEFEELDDILSTTSAAFLGLTLGCARCHDHKFDPIPQADYYRLLAFFRNVSLYENARYALDSPNYVPLASRASVEMWKSRQQTRLKTLEERMAGVTNAAVRKKLTGELEQAKADQPPFEWALAVRERGPKPPATQVLIRGNAGSPGPEVEPGFLSVLGGDKPALAAPGPEATSSGRRRALGDWITRADNPLTARVMANRIWQHHFGRGLVTTTSDFGRSGAPPTHPLLLDWLAAEFIAGGWSMKTLHKTILQSAVYQMSSRSDDARALAVDPDNHLIWRQNLRRLEAESLRDTVLAISGGLNRTMGGRGFFPRLSGEVLAGQSRPGLDWERSTPAELARRSLYVYVRRTMPVPVLEAFDYSNTASPLSERGLTTVAPQALILLNDEFMQTQAAAFALRLAQESGPSPQQRLRRGFQLAVGREPTRRETALALAFLAQQEKAFASVRSRLTFRPEVPPSLSVDYMGRLQAADFLVGPADGWTYHRGRWSGAYEGIRAVDRARGPFALCRHESFADGTVEAKLVLHQASESAGFLFRAQADGDELRGYEVLLDPRRGRVALRRHAKEAAFLAESPFALQTGQLLSVRVQASGPRLRVWLNGGARPLLDVTDPEPLTAAGRVGLKAWGAALSLDDLVLRVGDRTVRPGDAWPLPAARDRALGALCLMLLNLNEVVYVD